MTSYNHAAPKLKNVKERFPYSADVPNGFRTHLQAECRRLYGSPYYRWQRPWGQSAWVIEPDAIWQYVDGVLYCKAEEDLRVITLAVLSKTKK